MSYHRRVSQVRRAIVASAVGTAIEWYDFFLYGVAAALVFPRVFFPTHDRYTGVLLSFSTYFVGFAARPLGAAVFGHMGDRVGRKASLIATLVMMGASTAAIGLIPGYDAIGIGGAVLLTLARVLQGIAVGGEWGGSVLLAAEWSEGKARGLAASWPQWGAPTGLLLANGAVALTTAVVGDGPFASWGWRVPFLASTVLVGVGMWIRTGTHEPPAFEKMRDAGRVVRAPVREVLRSHPREVILTALLRTGQQAPFYVFTTWVLTYTTGTLHFARHDMVRAVLVAAAVSMVTIPLCGHLSDRIGRRRVIGLGCVLMIGWPFAYFSMLEAGSLAIAFAAIVIALPLHDLQYGPQAAVIAESFPARLRYSGSSLGYQLASLTSGGPAPLIATYLIHRWSSLAVAIYVAVCGAISLVALVLLPDRQSRDLHD
ncbi:MAG: MHS family MFS transporter [Deltaproteobacteria bacterium]|nr:MHS family MFS transporter [Deltaproteobacteria bacterium]